MEKLISIGNLSYFKTLMDNKNNEKFGVAELPISSDGKVDLTQIRTDATPGKLYKVTDPNNKREGNLYFGTHAITFVASRMFTPGSNVSVQPGTIILSTGQYGLIYVFPMSTSAIYQLDISTKEDYYQAWVYDVTENHTYNKVYFTMPESTISTTSGKTAFTHDASARSFNAKGAANAVYESVVTLTKNVKNLVISFDLALTGTSGAADNEVSIKVTEPSGTESVIYQTTDHGSGIVQTGELTSGTKITLYFKSGTYEPENSELNIWFENYSNEVTDADLDSYITSLITDEMIYRRLMDNAIENTMNVLYNDLSVEVSKMKSGILNLSDQALNMSISNLDNNSDYRFFGPTNSGVTTLGFTFEGLSLGTADDFKFQVTFQTASSGCTFSLTETDSIKIKLTGDDVTDGVLNPVANKVYEIAFYWNGLFMSGIVRGVEHEASKIQYKITITNTSDSYPLYVGTDESLSNQLATIEKGKSQEFTLDENIIYARFSLKQGTLLDGSPSGCTITNVTYSGFPVYKIEITNSPAACSFKSNDN